MINWFDMPAEGLSNGGLFEVKELEVTENGTYEEKGEMYNKVIVNVEGGGGGGGDYIVELQTINIPAQSVTGVYDAEAQFYIALEEITDANASVLDDYSYDENFRYNKFIKTDNAVGTFESLTLDLTGFPEDIFSASLFLNGENKWVVEIAGETAFTVTLNPQTVIAYRPTEDVVNYFKDFILLIE